MTAAGEDDLWDLVVSGRQGVLATLKRDGAPQMSNVLYVTDPDGRVVRISTTGDRAKARNLTRDPRAALHVLGDDFWNYAVAEGTVTLSGIATTPGDDATRELLAVHSRFYGDQDPDAFGEEMIAARRLVVRLHVDRLYGIIAPGGRRPAPAPGTEG
ncbi:MAG TPA: PPOX class F420-dependent oxidoreductase [Mycobacteriales bacterium]